MKHSLIIAAASALIASPVMAADDGFYIGGDVGTSRQGVEGIGSKEQSPTTWGLYGGYNINRNFGVELGYQALGKAKLEGHSETKSQAFGADFVARYPVAEQFDIFGKAGLAYLDRKTDFVGGGDRSDSGAAAKLGFGAEFLATKNVAIRAEVAHYMGGPAIDGANYEYKKNFSTFTMGANYRF